MSEERRTSVEQMKAIGRQDRSESRAVIITTVLSAATLALFALAWTGRCPVAAAGPTTAVNPTTVVNPTAGPADTSPATDADHEDQAENAEAEWLTDFEQAFATAERLDRPVLIDFAASWCVPCQMMDKHVWPQEKVRRVLAEQVVPLKVEMDATGVRSLVQRFLVRVVPTIVLVDPRGEDLERAGYVSADKLVEFVNNAR